MTERMQSSRPIPILATLALSLMATLGASPARANGRFPRAQHVVTQPGTLANSVAIRSTFGLLLSDDSGASFRFYCEEAFQYLDGQDPSILLSPGGALLVGTPDGLMRLPPDRCAPARVPELDGQSVIDLTSDPSGLVVFAALASSDPISVARVARSDDGGRTFRVPVGGFAGIRLETVEVAPSNATRVYATGYETASQRDVLLRSDDGGATFEHALGFVAGTSGWFVSGVDSRDANVLYIRANVDATTGLDAADVASTALLRSVDGGEHFSEIARTNGPMRGFAMSDDGRSVWIGSPEGGIERSDGGGPFVPMAHVPVECLRFDRGALLVCESFVLGGVLLGRSNDRGATVDGMLRFSEIQSPPSCPSGTIVHDICPSRWSQIRAQIAPSMPVDASIGDGHVDPPTSCGCRVGSPASRRTPGALLIASIAIAARRRRRAY